MIRVGITGGIGSGKSTVCKIIEVLGGAVYYTDTEAKRLMNSAPEIIGDITALLGKEAYCEGVLNNKYVAQKVFAVPDLLKKLNGIVHPAVFADFDAWSRRQSSDIVFLESAILIESGLADKMDKVIVVTAPEELRIRRTVKRDGIPEDAVRARIAKQLTDTERIAYADFIITADDICLVIPQVVSLYRKLLQEAG